MAHPHHLTPTGARVWRPCQTAGMPPEKFQWKHLYQEVVTTGLCTGCSVKLLDYLDRQLSEWETRIAAGERPSLADLSRLGGASRKVYRALAANGLVAE